MSEVLELDIKELVVSNSTFGPQEIKRLTDAIAEDYSNYGLLRDAVGELDDQPERSPASEVRLGVCSYLLGRYSRAIEALKSGDGGALTHFYLGKSHLIQENFDAAVESFIAARTAGYNPDLCALARVEALRYAKDAKGALQLLDELSGAVEQTAEYLYQRGATVAALGGNPEEVVALYERAVETDGAHAGALFGLALENDRHGNDATAMDLYQRATGRFPAHLGSLLNLGIMHEDRQEYDRARRCFMRILQVYPSHGQARLFLKDTEASLDMYYDEEAQRRRDRHASHREHTRRLRHCGHGRDQLL